MHTVIGIFPNRMDADRAVSDLEGLGYDPKDISIVVRDGATREERVGTKGGSAAQGVVAGATTGGVLGGLAGLLIGLGAITIPGIGAFLIGGPLAAALGLTGAAATAISGATTGVLAGGLVGGLASLGVPEETARVYEERVREGGVLLAVTVPDQMGEDERVKSIFQQYNADQVRSINDNSSL